MKNLCNLTYEERRNLYRNVEDFFVVAKQYDAFLKEYKLILEKVGVKFKLELWCLFTGTLKAIKYDNYRFKIPMRQETYTKYNRCSKQNISYSRMRTLVTKLDSLGLLELYKGYWFSGDDCMSSFIELSNEWLNMFPDHLCKIYGIARQLDLIEVVRTDYVFIKGKKTKIKTPLPTKGLRGIKAKRDNLLSYNKILSKTVIRIKDQLVTNIIYKRKFEIGLDGHGRFYTIGGFQSEKSYLRSTITLNGEETVEWDIKATQPSILFTWAGIKMPEGYDPYKIITSFDCDQKQLRSFCKVSLLCILFNATKKGASSAMVDKIRKDKKKCEEGKDCEYRTLHNLKHLCSIILKELLVTNKAISKFFFHKELWYKLQNADARICEYVIDKFTSFNIPLLSIHDSWVVGEKYSELLQTTIKDAWFSVLGNVDNFSIDKK